MLKQQQNYKHLLWLGYLADNVSQTWKVWTIQQLYICWEEALLKQMQSEVAVALVKWPWTADGAGKFVSW